MVDEILRRMQRARRGPRTERTRAKIAEGRRRWWASRAADEQRARQREQMRELNVAYAAWKKGQDR